MLKFIMYGFTVQLSLWSKIEQCNGFCRYQRGNRSLVNNLQKEAVVQQMMNQKQEEEEEDEGYDIPEELEDVIGKEYFLLNTLILSDVLMPSSFAFIDTVIGHKYSSLTSKCSTC
jgi:hypothetical protein